MDKILQSVTKESTFVSLILLVVVHFWILDRQHDLEAYTLEKEKKKALEVDFYS